MSDIVRTHMYLVDPFSFMGLFATFMHNPILKTGNFFIGQVSSESDFPVFPELIIQRPPVSLQLLYTHCMVLFSNVKYPFYEFAPTLSISGFYSGNFG